MRRPWGLAILVAFTLFVLFALWAAYRLYWGMTHEVVEVTEVVERTDYRTRPQRDDARMTDDRLPDPLPEFDPTRIDSRPLDGWQLNASGAVIRIDSPMIRADVDGELTRLRATYGQAIAYARTRGLQVLPSANLIDGKGKQIDDGLVAAVELAVMHGHAGGVPGVLPLVRALYEDARPGDADRPFLAAALRIAGEGVDRQALGEDAEAADDWVDRFDRSEWSRPLGFYVWNDSLRTCWRFLKFLQMPLEGEPLPIVPALAARIQADPQRAEAYAALQSWYTAVCNPPRSRSVTDPEDPSRPTISFLPSASSREGELFARLFPLGIPEGANLMAELIGRIRSGEIDLAPRPGEGWYQHQVYALQTLLVTEDAQEADKLQLTAAYKRRLMEAFEAMITKRRETHLRMLGVDSATAEAPPLEEITPRLRVEPTATFYLRTARAYGFLEGVLVASIGEEELAALHGMAPHGPRSADLLTELRTHRERCYGLYLIVCEDIGMRPDLAEDELADPAQAMAQAATWLEHLEEDPDLAIDTRVGVPVYLDPFQGTARMWGTLGIRLAKLEAEYVVPPKIRPLPSTAADPDEGDEEDVDDGDIGSEVEASEWTDAERWQLAPSRYVIPVDEFSEFQITGPIPTRDEFRAMCDAVSTKEEFVERYAK